jgi:DNA-binding NarL/FixJ family response regulator
MTPIDVVIADTNLIVRCGLNSILSSRPEVRVLGEAVNQDQLFELIESFTPAVVLIDFLSEGFSIDTVHQLKQSFPSLRLVAITNEQSAFTIVNALRAGIDSYIKKDCDVHEIIDSVTETGKGGKFFCGKILDSIRRESIPVDDLHIMEFSCEPVALSPRELEVIVLIAEGYTNNQIADKLFLSSHTVTTHRKNIMAKLGVNNTASIVMYAVKAQLVSPNKFLFSPETP